MIQQYRQCITAPLNKRLRHARRHIVAYIYMQMPHIRSCIAKQPNTNKLKQDPMHLRGAQQTGKPAQYSLFRILLQPPRSVLICPSFSAELRLRVLFLTNAGSGELVLKMDFTTKNCVPLTGRRASW